MQFSHFFGISYVKHEFNQHLQGNNSFALYLPISHFFEVFSVPSRPFLGREKKNQMGRVSALNFKKK